MTDPIYLDYMATTPIDPRVIRKMIPYLNEDLFGNPTSSHYYGYKAQAAVENARTQVANLINAEPENIIWTSGATEANNLAIKGAADFYKRQGKHIITSQTEHKSVLKTCKYLESIGFDVTFLTPDSYGLIDIDQLKKSIQKDTILVTIMHGNNEIGTIQNINDIGEITREKGILFHVDAAQTAGKIPIDTKELKVDLMSFSAHKIYGPKGIGALYIRSQPKLHITPQIHGGDHENNMRAGTLATHQIVGIGEAFDISNKELDNEFNYLTELRKKFWQGIKSLGGTNINGPETNRLPGNLSISFDGVDGEVLVAALKDIAISSTSACRSTCGDVTSKSSHVLQAIGLDNNLISNTLRISIGRFTTEEEVNKAIEHISEVVTKLRNN